MSHGKNVLRESVVFVAGSQTKTRVASRNQSKDGELIGDLREHERMRTYVDKSTDDIQQNARD